MMEMSTRELLVTDLGTMRYAEALELQRTVAQARISGTIEQDVLLLVEHPHVVTLGRSAKGKTLTASPALLAARGVETFEVDRGGDVTYHGPGQLVGYPIFDLRRHRQDLHWYLRQVEESLIVALRELRIEGKRHAGYTGVWVGEGGGADGAQSPALRKIASIGVHARDWVTWHGFALNVATDLSYFDLMIPCGIAGVTMTSVQRELARAEPGESLAPGDLAARVSRAVARATSEVFSLEPVEVSLPRLLAHAPTVA